MAVYNVRISVVELVDANGPEEAIASLSSKLTRAGFETFTDTDDVPDAFESEPLD